ncbi:outer membrane lipoprotein chaperone LolA [Celerinatantimonas diazotrophica]|uniref:Outer-membrane lipoprotein carrier protein n=1 Tax=Celerinatantimonas diazotrophica TaxID=412034 RepID=A0A4R1J7S5_9GAMM|nr:outer membrane lipoprotein chaperone LolA [Celerinatantimonas diazotrophica]TCK46522.1 outer membrane lipoprotein carrier protein [Celerinatantimonas diazotrophica]CAG9296572.1 Outer-membrane lipoprotein carrier protein [Celerinatantimonas diazotrophica]
MRQLRILGAIVYLLLSPLVMANPASDLRHKLEKISHFGADFSQTVISPEGKVIHRGKGHFVIAKPGKLHWQETHPGHDEIISDGKTIWYYSPMVEQVTIYNTSQAIVHTPFILLTDQREKTWKQYQVKQHDGVYTVSSKDPSQLVTFSLSFGKTGNIREFTVVDGQGQHSEFKLTHFNLHPDIQPGIFSFKVPKGTQIDDQRQ